MLGTKKCLKLLLLLSNSCYTFYHAWFLTMFLIRSFAVICVYMYTMLYIISLVCVFFVFFCRSTFVGSALSLRGGVAQWVARLTRNVEVMGSSPIKGPRCFLEQETLPLLLSTGWFQERA